MASTCSGDSPESALTGSSTVGLSQPITVGTSTPGDSSSRTGREICRLRVRRRTSAWSPTSAGTAPRDFRRWIEIHPPTRRTASNSTPAIQAATNHGIHRSIAPAVTADGAGEAGAIEDSITDAAAGSLATDVVSAGIITLATARSAVKARHVCTPVTSGIVAMSDNAIAATT